MDLSHVPATREKGWYLALMAPNTKGPNYAWLDPSRLYCHPQALQDCVADLLQPFQGDPIDLVAGIDAMGFILGAAVATALHKGFLAIRKAGHLCVETLSEPYTDYSGREKVMEVRTDTVSPGLRVLLVDQWVETGGTMRAAIRLVEQLGGVVAGRRGHPGVLPGGSQWVLSPLHIPQASQPSASRTARARGGSGSATSAPTACPPACSHASTTTKRAGNDAGAGTLHPQFGAFAAQFGFWHNQEINNSSCTLPLALPPTHRPDAFFKKHKKTRFIKTNGRLGASPPEWVCIAKGAAGVPAQPRPQGRLPGGGRGRCSLVRRRGRYGGGCAGGLPPHWQHLGFLRGADWYRSLWLLVMSGGKKEWIGDSGGHPGGHPGGGQPGVLTHGVADPAGAAALQLRQHAALEGQRRHTEEEIPHVLPCPTGLRPPEPLVSPRGGPPEPPPRSWDPPVSEDTAQNSACISWATLSASFSIRLYCAGVCQKMGCEGGAGDSPHGAGGVPGRGTHSRSGPSWSPPGRG
uniref:adenine phosphoribosyltransferase n=1 Tax=Anas platyrhynchos TaxID=8839 RepID=A0A8B9R200_ANAPL